jgi:hypothetical protein
VRVKLYVRLSSDQRRFFFRPINRTDVLAAAGAHQQACASGAPLLVHCSTGAGRAGTVVAIDFATKFMDIGLLFIFARLDKVQLDRWTAQMSLLPFAKTAVVLSAALLSMDSSTQHASLMPVVMEDPSQSRQHVVGNHVYARL